MLCAWLPNRKLTEACFIFADLFFFYKSNKCLFLSERCRYIFATINNCSLTPGTPCDPLAWSDILDTDSGATPRFQPSFSFPLTFQPFYFVPNIYSKGHHEVVVGIYTLGLISLLLLQKKITVHKAAEVVTSLIYS